MMGTRSGDIDPGVVTYLMKEKGFAAEEIEHLVNSQSGLLGVSGLSPDMKTLLEKKDSVSSAAEAIDMFCYQVRKTIGSFTAVLGGIDTLVFTGGIGERSEEIRRLICKDLDYLGIDIDEGKNKINNEIISTSRSVCSVRVIPTNEEKIIVRKTKNLLFTGAD